MSIGLYIHVPFCLKKCSYCSFVSSPFKEGDESIYAAALTGEMKMRADLLTAGEKKVDSIFIGGGTPTCLSEKHLALIFESIFHYFSVDASSEITVESNPGTLNPKKLATLKEVRVNRISMGVQACQPELLNLLGRIHSYRDAEATYFLARAAGFNNISMDLMFGIPGQTMDQWKECLERVSDLRPDHISAYCLHLEVGTPLYDRVMAGEAVMSSEDLEADMFSFLIDYLRSLGYAHYEISNFALAGRSCRHNLKYWNNERYLGLGPSAHSSLGGRRFSNDPGLARYALRISEGVLPQCWEEKIDVKTEMSETVFLGLRLVEGLDTEEFRKRFGLVFEEVYRDQIQRLVGLGLIEFAGQKIRLSQRGLMLGNMVFAEFVG